MCRLLQFGITSLGKGHNRQCTFTAHRKYIAKILIGHVRHLNEKIMDYYFSECAELYLQMSQISGDSIKLCILELLNV